MSHILFLAALVCSDHLSVTDVHTLTHTQLYTADGGTSHKLQQPKSDSCSSPKTCLLSKTDLRERYFIPPRKKAHAVVWKYLGICKKDRLHWDCEGNQVPQWQVSKAGRTTELVVIWTPCHIACLPLSHTVHCCLGWCWWICVRLLWSLSISFSFMDVFFTFFPCWLLRTQGQVIKTVGQNACCSPN